MVVTGIHSHAIFKYSIIKIRSVALGGDLRESSLFLHYRTLVTLSDLVSQGWAFIS